MKTSKELKELRGERISELEAIKQIAEARNTDLNAAENQEVDTLLKDVETLDTKIERADKIEANLRVAAMSAGSPLKSEKPKEYKQWSLFKAIKDFQNHNLSGVEAEMHQEAARNNIISGLGIPVGLMCEKRANPQTTSNAAEFIPTEVGEWLQTLQSKMVLGDLATFYSGLRGDVNLPVLSATTAGWAATETASAGDAATAVGGSTLQPKRLTSYMDVSKALLHQNPQVEAAIMTDLNRAVASKVESGALTGSGSSGEPSGVSTDATGSVASGGITLPKLIEFETDVATNNADVGDSLAYISSVKVRGMLKQKAGDIITTSGASGPMWRADNTVNGYPAFATTNMLDTYNTNTEGGLYFGAWSDLVIGQFGDSLDITIDNFSQAISGSIRLVINSYWDCAVRRGGSFTICEGVSF